MSDSTEPTMPQDEDVRVKLNRETSKIAWRELQKFYAKGMVVVVNSELDLIDVAAAFTDDDKSRVGGWLESGQVERANDQHALAWYEQDSTVWAVVVAPWVLVQQPTLES
jgi:hypothetical protein